MALDELWGRLREAGFRVGANEHLQVEVLLQGLEGFGDSIDRARLCGLLCPLLARTPEEQFRFRNIFVGVFRDDPVVIEIAPPPPVPVEDTPDPDPELSPVSTWHQRGTWAVAVALMVLLIGIGPFVKRIQTTATPTPAVPLATPPPRENDPTPSPTPGAAPTPEPLRLALVQTESKVSPWRLPWLWGLGILVPIGLALDWKRRSLARRAAGRGRVSLYDRELRLPEGEQLYSFAEPPDVRVPIRVRHSSIGTRPGLGDRLDMQRTIEATVREGGALHLIPQMTTYRRTIVALVEFENRHDHRTPYYLALLRRLDRLGAQVSVFFLERGGTHARSLVRRERGFLLRHDTPLIPLADALRGIDRRETTLVYLGGEQPLSASLNLLSPLQKVLAEPWQETRALVAQGRDLIRWRALEAAIGAVATRAAEPVVILSPFLQKAIGQRSTAYWTDENAQRVAQELVRELPYSALTWLSACMALPEVRWDLTMDMGRALEETAPHQGPFVCEENLLFLLQFPWFQGSGQRVLRPVPRRLRGALLRLLPEELRRPVHARAEEILLASLGEAAPWTDLLAMLRHNLHRWLARKPDTELPQGRIRSHVDAQFGIELALQAVQKGDQAGLEKLVAWLDRNGLDEKLCQDVVFPKSGPASQEELRQIVWTGRIRVGKLKSRGVLALLWLGIAIALSVLGARLFPQPAFEKPLPPEKRIRLERGADTLDLGVQQGQVEREVTLQNNTENRTLEVELSLGSGEKAKIQMTGLKTKFPLKPGEPRSLKISCDASVITEDTTIEDKLLVRVTGEPLLEVPITLRAVAPGDLPSTALDFGQVVQNETALIMRSVPLNNPSQLAERTIRVVGITGQDAAQFAVDGLGTNIVLKPGKPGQLSVRYLHKKVGKHQAVLRLREGSRVAEVSLTGETLESFVGRRLTIAQFREYLSNLKLKPGGFRPEFVALHDAGVPSLKDRPNGFTSETIKNAIDFHNSRHTVVKPHVFIDQNGIWIMHELNQSVNSTVSYSKNSIGVYLLGNYNTELLPDTVRTNAVGAIAEIDRWLGAKADTLKFHRDDPAARMCPGKNVNKSEILEAVQYYPSRPPGYEPDERSANRIATLRPKAQPYFLELLKRLNVDVKPIGLEVKVISAYTTWAEQDALYAKGRTQPGPKMTNARGGQSNHNFQIAVDVGLFKDGKYLDESSYYERMGPIGEALGLEWGGRWTDGPDLPHFQIKTGKSISALRELVRTQGWEALDALIPPFGQDNQPQLTITPNPIDAGQVPLAANFQYPRVTVRVNPGYQVVSVVASDPKVIAVQLTDSPSNWFDISARPTVSGVGRGSLTVTAQTPKGKTVQGTVPVSWVGVGQVEPVLTLAQAADQAERKSFTQLAKYLRQMVAVKAGTFTMGADDISDREKPPHQVTLTKPFYLGKTEVTVAMWREYANAMLKGQMPTEPGFNQGWKNADHPIVNVSWDDIRGETGRGGYCQWASEVCGITLTLPTEAQWEYAARGPQSLLYPWGNDWDATKRANSVGDTKLPGAVAVGSYSSDVSWCGALDMAGNVAEWCLDYQGAYKTDAVSDPVGSWHRQGATHAFRGGTGGNDPKHFRGAYRDRDPSQTYIADLGFRLSSG